MSGYLPHAPRIGPLLAVLDGAAMAAAVGAAHLVRFTEPARSVKLAELGGHPVLLIVSFLGMWALTTAAELYEPPVLRSRAEVTSRVAVVAACWGAGLALATYVVPSWSFGRGLLLITGTVWASLATALRWTVRRWLTSRPRPRVLVVGNADATSAVVARLDVSRALPWAGESGAGVPPSALAAEVRRRGVEMVVVAGQEGTNDLGAELSELHFSGVPVVLASEIIARLEGRLPVSEMAPGAFLHQPGFGAVHSRTFNRVTRVLDVVLGSAMFVVSIPLAALGALAVLVTDGAPALFRQVRLGQYGRPFTLYKIRTMRRDAEENGPAFAAPDDPRATRIGRWLRRLRVDELPQLVNVLKGEMSLVGPRPERPEFVVELTREIPYYAFRLVVPPGLTGWSQINMPYARTPEEHRRKLEYDLYFIRERSLRLYLMTLLRTVSAALLGRGK